MLAEVIDQRRARVLDRWRERVLAGYPAETARFLRREQDRFANPVGHAVRELTEATLEAIVRGRPAGELTEPLDRLVRVRAVQDLTPAQAVGFVLELKAVLREELAGVPTAAAAPGELGDLEDWLDRLLLLSFDLYSRCREQVFEIRVQDIRNRALGVSDRLNQWRARRDRGAEGLDRGAEP
jgi:hypothetical protein